MNRRQIKIILLSLYLAATWYAGFKICVPTPNMFYFDYEYFLIGFKRITAILWVPGYVIVKIVSWVIIVIGKL